MHAVVLERYCTYGTAVRWCYPLEFFCFLFFCFLSFAFPLIPTLPCADLAAVAITTLLCSCCCCPQPEPKPEPEPEPTPTPHYVRTGLGSANFLSLSTQPTSPPFPTLKARRTTVNPPQFPDDSQTPRLVDSKSRRTLRSMT